MYFCSTMEVILYFESLQIKKNENTIYNNNGDIIFWMGIFVQAM